MRKKYPHLFSPIKIGGLTLNNRILMAPALGVAQFQRSGDYIYDYYNNRASGCAGMVTVGESHVVPTLNNVGPDSRCAVFNPSCIYLYARMAEIIHRYGSVASLELVHEGAGEGNPLTAETASEAGGEALWFKGAVGPSEIANPYTGSVCRAMSEADIDAVVDAFAVSAYHLKLADFDMVTLHGGHGWLLSQFLSPKTNRRTDRFGGSHENRVRILRMTADRIREKCGADFPIELRISGRELDPKGYQIEDCIEFCKLLEDKIDLFSISCSTLFDKDGRTVCSPTPYLEPGCNAWLAAEVKRHVKKPVAAIGSLVNPDQMEELIASGKADMVAAARTFIADPLFPQKALRGESEDIRPCIRCLNCLDDNDVRPAQIVRCAVNPIIGRETQYLSLPNAKRRRRVLVAGGGPGGMQAAITATELGHDVTLCEKESELGGELRFSSHVSFKADLERYRRWLIHTLNASGAEVRLGVEVDAAYIERMSPDVVICAVGADSVIPPISGVDGKNVIPANRVHEDGIEIGSSVVIIGGGLVGCEAAIDFAIQGKKPVVLEMADNILPRVDGAPLEYTRVSMDKHKVERHTGVRVTEIDEKGVHAVGSDGGRLFYPADTVVIAVGYRPREILREALRAPSLSFIPIGDCKKVGRIKEATAAGFAAAVSIY